MSVSLEGTNIKELNEILRYIVPGIPACEEQLFFIYQRLEIGSQAGLCVQSVSCLLGVG